jgi:hypothetical protein
LNSRCGTTVALRTLAIEATEPMATFRAGHVSFVAVS